MCAVCRRRVRRSFRSLPGGGTDRAIARERASPGNIRCGHWRVEPCPRRV